MTALTETPETVSQTACNGPAWAGILAAGIGCAALGGLVDLAEAFKSVSNALNFYDPTGDLSGKTTVALTIWLIAWAVLHARWSRRDIRSPVVVTTITAVLILLALVAVFPPFIGLFAAS